MLPVGVGSKSMGDKGSLVALRPLQVTSVWKGLIMLLKWLIQLKPC